MMKVLADDDNPAQFSLGTALLVMLHASLTLGLHIHSFGLATIVADVILLDIVALLFIRFAKKSPSAILVLVSAVLVQFALTATTLLAIGGFLWIFFALFG